jgi:hypothetical protein
VSDWYSRAACRGKPIGWWFPGTRDVFSTRVALLVCKRCPVRAECLDAALVEETSAAYTYGVRGGLAAVERIVLLRRSRSSS